MKVYHNLLEFKKLENAVVTIGTFDGVHIGHQKIINQIVREAHRRNAESVILTFFPHPRMIIDPENQNLKMISTLNEKAEMLANLGVDHLIITPFTRDFSNTSADDYIKNILVDTIGIKHIIIGYDHRFGKNRNGNLEDLKRGGEIYKFTIEEIPEQDIHDVAVSSSKIREAILGGVVSLAADYLGYPFSISGQVIKGDKIGRTIGFPTANIFVEETYKLIPSDGIYAVMVEMDSEVGSRKSEIGSHEAKDEQPAIVTRKSKTVSYTGMAYIGQRPTINGMTRNIEVNIFNFDKEIYGQSIRMNFLKFLRHDEKFNSLENLKFQLELDKKHTLEFFALEYRSQSEDLA